MTYKTVALAAMLAVAVTAAPRADILEQVLVKVNGDIITKTELEQRQIAVLRQRDPGLRPTNDAELQRALQEITPDVIVDAVDELLFVQRGRELGYALSDEQFRSIVDNIRKENKIETDEQFTAALKQEGMTMDDLRRQLERQMLYTRVQQAEVTGKVDITDVELREYYGAHKQDFTTTPRVTLRELLVAVPAGEQGVNVAQDDEARAKAESIHARLEKGEPFARLAGDVSDSGSKANGGLIGPIAKSDLSADLQAALTKLKPGGISDVMRTPRGYQIVQLEAVDESRVRPFDEVRQQISDKLMGEKRQAETEKYLKKLRAEAIIEWKNDEVKKAYEIGLQRTAS